MDKQQRFYEQLKQTPVWLHFEDGSSFEGFINKPFDSKHLKNGIIGEAAFTLSLIHI